MKFDATIEPPGGIVVPFDVREVFGTGRVPVRVVVNGDTEYRTIEAPPDLTAALDDETRTFFESLSFTHRKEYVQWVESAKREETRRNRIAKAAQMLRDRVRHP